MGINVADLGGVAPSIEGMWGGGILLAVKLLEIGSGRVLWIGWTRKTLQLKDAPNRTLLRKPRVTCCVHPDLDLDLCRAGAY